LSERKGCFKTGCLGCLGVTVVVGVILVALVVLGLVTGGRETRFEPFERTYLVPEAGPPPAADRADAPGEALAAREIDVAEPGRIVLDFNRGSFEIRPVPAGESLRLEGRYDVGRFELTESFENYGEAGWIYRVGFDQKGFGLRPFVETEGRENHVQLLVPRDVPIVLEGRVGMGRSELDLSGLWLLEVDLEVGIGEHAVSFDEPSPVPMDRFRLDTSIGVIDVSGLGHASPRDVRIKHSIGETTVDLRGAWRRDAEVFISCGIGECDVRVPDDVGLEIDRAGVTIGDSSGPRSRPAAEAGRPTLTLSVGGSIGEVRVR